VRVTAAQIGQLLLHVCMTESYAGARTTAGYRRRQNDGRTDGQTDEERYREEKQMRGE